MQYRKLGKTNLNVSVIGFGASALGNVFGDVNPSACNQAVNSAIDSGINLFDVSPYYGLTLAESRLGEALQGRRSEVYLGTKCGRYGADRFDFSAQTITANFEQSLRRLRTEYVDILQVHDIEFGDVDQIVGETVVAMERLREQGKVRFLGMTAYWPDLLARVAVGAGVDCVLNYCHANLFADDMLRELAPAAACAHIGLLNASPLHMGLLGNRPIPDWHPAPPEVREAAEKVRALCAREGVNPGTLALRVCLDFASVSSTFVGLSSADEVHAASAALEWTPPPSLLDEVRAVLRPVYNVSWASGLEQNQNSSFTAGVQDVAS